MNSCIASTRTVHTLVTHSNARPPLTPEQRLFPPLSPCSLDGQHCRASPPAFPTPASGTGLQFTARRQQMVSGFPYSEDYFARGFMRGHQARTFTLRTTSMATATLFYSQRPLKRAAGTEESRRNKFLPHHAQETSAQNRSKLRVCLAAFLFISLSEGKCQVLLREQEAFRATYGGEQLREK